MSRSENPGYRIVYSNDGLIYGTFDHYESVFEIYHTSMMLFPVMKKMS